MLKLQTARVMTAQAELPTCDEKEEVRPELYLSLYDLLLLQPCFPLCLLPGLFSTSSKTVLQVA